MLTLALISNRLCSLCSWHSNKQLLWSSTLGTDPKATPWFNRSPQLGTGQPYRSSFTVLRPTKFGSCLLACILTFSSPRPYPQMNLDPHPHFASFPYNTGMHFRFLTASWATSGSSLAAVLRLSHPTRQELALPQGSAGRKP